MAVRARKTKRTKAKKSATKKKRPARKKRPAKTKDRNAMLRKELVQRFRKDITDAYNELCRDVKKEDRKALLKDASRLRLLLGECHYLANEYKKCVPGERRKRR